MTSSTTSTRAVLALPAGTLALRCTGPALRDRSPVSASLEERLDVTVAVLLAALVATAALLERGPVAGIARPARVAVAGLLTWRGAPFVVAVLTAAASTSFCAPALDPRVTVLTGGQTPWTRRRALDRIATGTTMHRTGGDCGRASAAAPHDIASDRLRCSLGFRPQHQALPVAGRSRPEGWSWDR